MAAPPEVMVEIERGDLATVKKWIDARDFTTAGTALTGYLADQPEDADAWFLIGRLLLEQDNPALARMVYNYLTSGPGADKWQNWLNLGKAYDHLNLADEAEEFYRKALELSPDNPAILPALATNLVQQYRAEDAIEVAKRAVRINPDGKEAVSTMGFAHIQMRDFANGWDCYEAGYGKLRWRNERLYFREGRWDGTKRKDCRVIVHGEQGIGDQMAGLEPLRDMIANTSVVAVEVSPKIEGLVRRSFPEVPVYGTLGASNLDWPYQYQSELTAHAGVFSLHRHFRRSEDAYPGKPYLVADPDRRTGWRAILDALGPEPKIGLAWSGGVSLTQRSARRAALEDWLPILKQPAHFVALEYKPRANEIEAIRRRRGVTIHDWPWATQTDDYDDTAALVAELDMVITVPTTIVHLAGGLGVPTMCLTHPRPNLHYCARGDTIAYYGDTVRLYRRETNEDWKPSVRAVANALRDWIDARNAA
jgi:tetratricopeptide (TPR) repeat protein